MDNKKRNPVGWFEIYVDDMDRAATFYESVFKTKLEQMSDPTNQSMQIKSFPGNMQGYGTPGALVKMDGMKAGGSNIIIYFSCEEADTEGNTIGLHSMK